jgi:hypothetical protein
MYLNRMKQFAKMIKMENEMKVGKVVDKSKCISAIRQIEENKLKQMDNIKKAVKTGQIPQQAVPMILEIEQQKVMDRLFLETGIEKEDIDKTVRELKLHEEEAFKKIKVDIQEKMAKLHAEWAKM